MTLKYPFPQEPLEEEVVHYQFREAWGKGRTKETTLQAVLQGKISRMLSNKTNQIK